MKLNVKKLVIVLLFSSALLAGIVLLFFGIKDSVSLAIKTKDWFEAPGYFRDCSVYNVNSEGETLYRLRYVFYSGGAEYFGYVFSLDHVGSPPVLELCASAELPFPALA